MERMFLSLIFSNFNPPHTGTFGRRATPSDVFHSIPPVYAQVRIRVSRLTKRGVLPLYDAHFRTPYLGLAAYLLIPCLPPMPSTTVLSPQAITLFSPGSGAEMWMRSTRK